MTTFATCASCEGAVGTFRVERPDGTYCCLGCTAGGPCVCTYDDVDLDRVDGLGLPFAVAVADVATFEPVRETTSEAPVLVG